MDTITDHVSGNMALWHGLVNSGVNEMYIKELPSQKDLHKALNYDPETGIFIWKKRNDQSSKWNGKFAGKIAGSKNIKNASITFNWIGYPAHRLAWVYIHGDVLTSEIQVDHKNNNPFDNRIDNLRLATHSQNCSNARKWENKSLPKGVSQQTTGDSYRARLQVAKKIIYIGSFPTPELAHAAYCEAAMKYHGEFARIE